MPLSLSKVIVHIVFSTKDRALFIDDAIREKLHAYLASVARENKCESYRVNGTDDHVHLAIRLARTINQSELLGVLKRSSSKWIKTQGAAYAKFSWQRGFGCFSVSPKNLPDLVSYIANQQEHHRKTTFKEEYVKFLQQYGVDYDKQYLWD